MTTFRERAIAAYRDRQTEEATTYATLRTQAARTLREQFEKAFGCAPDVVDPDRLTASLEDIRLRYFPDRDWRYIAVCAACGDELLSWRIANLADLGRHISGDGDWQSHRCVPVSAGASLEARLLALLREFIATVVEERE